MNSLISGIESIVQNAVEEYICLICKKYDNIEKDELEKLWNNTSNSVQISVKNINNVKSPQTNSNNTDSSKDGCPYAFLKGVNKGNICGCKTKSDKVYCSRHKKHEGTVQKIKKSMPNNDCHKQKEQKEPINVKEKEDNINKKRILRQNKNIGKLWHPETRLVFKSFNNRTVIGKYNETENCINNLTDKDIDDCKRWGFPYESQENTVDNSDNEEDNSDEDEKQEDTDTVDNNEEDEKQEDTDTDTDTIDNSDNEEDKIGETIEEETLIDEEDEEETLIDEEDEEETLIDEEDVIEEFDSDEDEDSVKLINKEQGKEKFWNCIVKDNTHTTEYGKVGKKGKTKTKTFDTYEQAKKEMDKNVKSKIKKGYEYLETPSVPSDIEDSINEMKN